ncbi:diaminobutyrate--2-oxoglutarate transaminase [Roseibium sp. RKSG952]|uniref:diaminobutyrate--2-oxoglutarate transaminase n=1 Tax=Roseibium sp. RKSG952 TaxID=2529384 RepID=UPI0012BC45F0|nr:diaminobutyrate--2-oxoglutarate transaminase [Roseibium sp. RKSG952]MTH94810.1 diaminobutyrate--2-oxoglutarate transaminase [Roseibium sp. RKSG952]
MLCRNETSTTVFDRCESSVRSYCRRFPARFARATGSELFDVSGARYIDFLAGCGSLNFGHNHPAMKAALIDYLEMDGIGHALDLHTDVKARFIDTFERIILTPRKMNHRLMFVGPTGTNAIEAALKVARKATGRSNVIAFTNGFHGVTQGALAATGSSHHRGSAEALLAGVTRLPFDGYLGADLDTADLLEKLLEDPSSGLDAPAAILLECIQGEGGLNVASSSWLRRISALAKKHGAVLIIDEIQAGCGRSGPFFAFERAGIVPDVVTMAKSISGFGLPMAMVLVNPDLDVFGHGEHNGTFRGNSHAFLTGHVMLENFWESNELAIKTTDSTKIVTDSLRVLSEILPHSRLKGLGMMQGIDVGSQKLADNICRNAFELGLIIETAGPHDEVLKILPPLTTSEGVLREGLSYLHQAATKSI